MSGLQVLWTKHLPDADRREDFEKTLRNNTLIFRRLTDILTEMEQSIYSETRGTAQYNSPAWDCLQAHRNGNLETLKKLKDLISFSK
jgi:hypothetical protein